MKRVYAFSEGSASMKDILGGKGANLAEMTRLGLPVPQGFTITTKACLEYLEHQKKLLEELKTEVLEAVKNLEQVSGKKFNDPESLLLVSVRSGAKISMPGMMDTILNVGLNDENVEKFAKLTNNPRFAYDCYRRLMQMYGNVVFDIDMNKFESVLTRMKKENHLTNDAELTTDHLKEVVKEYHQIYQDSLGHPFPSKVEDQIFAAVEAVFKSWDNERAIVYRRLNNIPHDLGTAVNIQEMVFGNRGETSGTGVLFTRNPANGEHKLYGEYLTNAQGEDVVAGIRTPMSIQRLEDQFPEIYQQLLGLTQQLEKHYQDMQDIEFTIEEEKLYLLQTRNGKRTAQSAVKVACDFVEEGLLTEDKALLTIQPESLNQLLHPAFDPKALSEATVISKQGLPASPGAATGEIVFDAETAKTWTDQGKAVILVRHETSPEDIVGMVSAKAIVTSQGGMTSHAAVVARGMGKCCVAGCSELDINEENKILTYPGGSLKEGDVISVDGTTGTLYLGEITTTAGGANEYFDRIMDWARKYANMEIRMNAETENDIQNGLNFGASGIGLVRTEHMFFQNERIKSIREFLLAKDKDTRLQALDVLKTYQSKDFQKIFELMQDKPVVVRLLDMPLHEFLPHTDTEIQKLATDLNQPFEELKDRVHSMREINPMMGHRGCRMGSTYPELYLMQAESVIVSAIELAKQGVAPKPEIMIPLVSTHKELANLKEIIKEHLDQMITEAGVNLKYMIGTMVETPRACLIADQLATESEFFSFGTNDLTQLTFGYSRDDAGKFLNQYLESGVLADDPFQTVDKEAILPLIALAVEKGRKIRPELEIGVCGELGGDPRSIEQFQKVGLTYVSCSPYRVPIAQVAAAQAAIRSK